MRRALLGAVVFFLSAALSSAWHMAHGDQTPPFRQTWSPAGSILAGADLARRLRNHPAAGRGSRFP